MKTIAKISGILLVIALLGVIITSCKKENQNANITVRMTDSPADYLQVNVDITGLEVHHESLGWISLPIKAGIYNLLDLQNSVSVVLADKAEFPIGHITQIRLILGSNNTVVTLSGIFPLTVRSGSETGLKINADQDILANKSVDILFDFDANASVVLEGNGKYSLKPVLRILSITQI